MNWGGFLPRVAMLFVALWTPVESYAIETVSRAVPTGQSVSIYLPSPVKDHPERRVPLVFVLHHTGGNPVSVVNGPGWTEKAAVENFDPPSGHGVRA